MTIRVDRSARRSLWRTGRWLCCGLWLIGCGDSKQISESEPGHEPTRQASDTPDDSKPAHELPPDEVEMVPAINAAANDATIRAPLDATPSPKGERVYYTAFKQGEDEAVPGVFTVAADGGGDIQTLAEGAPLTSPVNLSISLDGERLYVADTASGDAARGAVLSLPASGGTPGVLAGTEGYLPTGLTIARVEDEEYLYFTGHHPDSGEAGVFRIDPAGGVADAVASGAPFGDPSGVTVSAKGDVYVVENVAEAGFARVLRVRDGAAESFVENIGVGFPAGITLSQDDSTLFVSGLDPATRRDVVYIVDVATSKLSRLTQVVGKFAEPAGLHRAHEANVFAWADSEANSTGTVYVLKP